MKNRLFWGLIAGLVLLMSTTTLVSAKSDGTDRVGFTEADSEFYMTDELFFFIRPGVVFELVDFVIPADLRPEVIFTIKDPGGLPLDREGVYTPGPVDTRFMLTYIPIGEEQKVTYHDRLRDRNGEYTTIELGTYHYKFTTVLPADYDVDATHTLGSVITRDLREFYLDRYYDNDVYNFVPSAAGEPLPRDIVSTSTCNRCHDPLSEHGGRYQEVQICQQCHLPDLFDEDEGLSYSMDVLIHRVHMEMGSEYRPELNDCSTCHTGGTPTDDYPLVANPNPAEACNSFSTTNIVWGDEGLSEVHLDSASGPAFSMSDGAGSQETGEWVMDGQVFVLVDTLNGDAISETTVDNTVFGCANNPPGTFRGTAGAQHDRWMTRPSRLVCGACHAEIDFENGVGHIAQDSDENCSVCHKPMGEEYDRSVAGAHQVDYKSSQLAGILVEVVDVEFTSPGSAPTVTFSLSDEFGPMNPADLGRFRITLAGPNDDFLFYAQEDALGRLTAAGDNWSYRFTTRLPFDAEGSYSVGFEGRMGVTLNEGEDNEFTMNEQMQNFIYEFAVTDLVAVPRRMIVDDAKCEDCHSNLSLHGANRNDANGYCQTCHRPNATDAIVRLEGVDESIHFKYMIHKLHMGAELENGFIVYGYRNSVHDYSHVEFPGDLRNCESCHVDDTYLLPLPDDVAPTFSPATAINPIMLPVAASCLSCHDSDSAASHSLSNTTELGESCNTCHGEGRTYGVERVHAR